jgi:hypothetical protein
MRHLIPTIFVLLLFSCSQDNTTTDDQTLKTNDSTFGSNLIDADFLKYADSLKIDSLTDQVKKSFYNNGQLRHAGFEVGLWLN